LPTVKQHRTIGGLRTKGGRKSRKKSRFVEKEAAPKGVVKKLRTREKSVQRGGLRLTKRKRNKNLGRVNEQKNELTSGKWKRKFA